MIVQEPVQAAIWHCLNHYAYQDATFLAERLWSEVDSDESAFTLATCYYRTNQIHQAFFLLQSKGSKTPQCRYLLAKCAYELKKFSYVESALTNDSFTESRHLDDICGDFGEVACFALQLIAKVCSQTERHDIAAEANRRALQLNPFLWQSFADLCNRGQKPDPKQIFQFTSSDTFATCQGHNLSAVIAFNNVQQQQQQQHPQFASAHQHGCEAVDATTAASAASLNSVSIHQTPVSSSAVVGGGGVNYDMQTPLNYGAHHGLITPNNHHQPQQQHCAMSGVDVIRNIDETPVSNGGVCNMDTDAGSAGAGGAINSSQTPFRKQFKYLSSISPSTPSFGFLPMSSPAEPASAPQQPPAAAAAAVVQAATGQQSLASVGKKLRGQAAGGLISRKDTPLQLSKPIFSQTGGNLTPRTPINTNASSAANAAANAAAIAAVNNNNNAGNNATLTGQNVRRSSRLSFSNCNSAVKENNKSNAAALNKFATPRSPPRKTKQRISKMNLANTALNELHSEKTKGDKGTIEAIAATGAANTDGVEQLLLGQPPTSAQQMLQLRRNSAEGLMALLRDLGNGYVQLCQYNCADAIEAFGAVAPHHYQSSWVQSMVAKAHYELHEYESAAKLFYAVHRREPHRLHLMEIYSTVLWHLHREVALSALAQDLVAQDKRSPVTWCVAGNCFSLHKEHETAIRFFERAVQVDPDFAYSYTLLGHELVITEELDKAMSCFRTAILKDSRHYNAWFGIGTIFSKQERYTLAEIHYQHALRINPRNSVIMVHIGTMQFALKHAEQALQTLNAAIRLDPKNPLCKFHRGSMYFQMGKDREALAELKELKQLLPKESVVYYLIGKIHKKMGNVAAALKHFSWATDLDPRGTNNQIKDAFDTNMSTSLVAGASGTTAGSTTAGSAASATVGTQVETMTPVAGGGGGGGGSGGGGGGRVMTAARAAALAAVNAAAMVVANGVDTFAGSGSNAGLTTPTQAPVTTTTATATAATTVGRSATNVRQMMGTASASSSGSSATSGGDSGLSVADGPTASTALTGRRLMETSASQMQARLREMGVGEYDEEEVEDDDDEEDSDMEGRDYDSDSY